MPKSLSKVIVHIVFSTKNRKPIIPAALENRLYKIIAGKIKSMRGIPIQINGYKDHIHVLTTLPRTISIANFIREIKTGSSQWVKTQGVNYKHFAWQNGYGIFSLSHSEIDRVNRYIMNQKIHHKTQNHKDEFIQILESCNIEYDEKFLWD